MNKFSNGKAEMAFKKEFLCIWIYMYVRNVYFIKPKSMFGVMQTSKQIFVAHFKKHLLFYLITEESVLK